MIVAGVETKVNRLLGSVEHKWNTYFVLRKGKFKLLFSELTGFVYCYCIFVFHGKQRTDLASGPHVST